MKKLINPSHPPLNLAVGLLLLTFNMGDIQQLLEILRSSDRILLASHESPDRDAVGSLISMKLILKQLEITNVDMLLEMKSPVRENFLKDQDQIIYKSLNEVIDQYDTLVVLDTNHTNRVSKAEIDFSKVKLVFIDHHDKKDGIESDLYVKFDTTSTCEGLYELFKDEVEIDSDIAKALLVGIYSDTGGFKYRGVSGRTLEIVNILIKAGVELSEIATEGAEMSANLLRAGSEILNHTTIDEEKKMFYGYLPKNISKKYNLGYDDIDQIKDIIIGMLIDVAEIEWGFLVKPKMNGTCTLSLRSKENSKTTAKEIALKFNGGGHLSAAGATVEMEDPEGVMNFVMKNLDL